MLRPLPSSPAQCAADQAASGIVVFEVASAAATGDNAAGPPPDWIKLTPRGVVQARDGRSFSFDPEKLAAAHAAGGLKLPIDFAHEQEHVATLGAKPARGWIVECQARADGLYARVEWLKDAVEALAAQAYRYVSPTFWLEADRATARLMKGAALVASPALGMPALASAATGDPAPMKTLLAKLGLTENATEDEAVAKLAAALTPDPAAFVPVAQLAAANDALAKAQGELKTIAEAGEAAKCQALIDESVKAGKIAPAAKDHYLALARADFDATQKAIAAMPVLVAGGEDDKAKEAAKAAAAGEGLAPEEIAMAAALGLTADKFKAAKAA